MAEIVPILRKHSLNQANNNMQCIIIVCVIKSQKGKHYEKKKNEQM